VLTVRGLVDELGFELLAGSGAADRPLRWVHIAELADPTPWLSGGELLLTTGMQLSTPHRQRALVRRLAEHGLAGLGFGTGFEHSSVPKALLDEAAKQDFPVFEVPYELPFIAITERAFERLVNEQYAVLKRSIGDRTLRCDRGERGRARSARCAGREGGDAARVSRGGTGSRGRACEQPRRTRRAIHAGVPR